MFGFGKKNVMFERLEALYRYSLVCTVDELESLDRITCDKQTYMEIQDHQLVEKSMDKKTTFKYFFNSGLGTVKIELDADFAPDCTKHYYLSYSNYVGSTVFKIDACKKRTEVTPMLGEYLMAEDIDLALYELESYLKVNLGTSKELEDKKNKEYKRQLQLHEEQIKILEGKN